MAKFGRNGAGPVPPTKPGALERVAALEEFNEEFLGAIRNTLAAVEARLKTLEENSLAIINVVGRPQVEEEATRLHIQRTEAKAAKEKAAFEAYVKKGGANPAEVVGDLSVIVGSEKGMNGEQLYPTRVQLLFQSLKPEYQEKLRGAKVGDSVDTPFDSKLTVTEIYDIVPGGPPKVETPPPAPEVAPLPQVEQPLSPAEEEKLAEDLAASAEEIEAQQTAVEEALVEELSAISEKAPQSS